MRILQIEETDSTNSHIARDHNDATEPLMVFSRRQTAGRGQRGNTWESAHGENLTASFLIFPEEIQPAAQFIISEAISLATIDLLEALGVKATVKWPNDIYAGDKKIAGILIEHNILGSSITKSIVGIGLNVNQEKFVSDAPNPVSLYQLTGEKYDIPKIASLLADLFEKRLSMMSSPEDLHKDYMKILWRNDGRKYQFKDKIRKEIFYGTIKDVSLSGPITISDETDTPRNFYFKEVEFLIPSAAR